MHGVLGLITLTSGQNDDPSCPIIKQDGQRSPRLRLQRVDCADFEHFLPWTSELAVVVPCKSLQKGFQVGMHRGVCRCHILVTHLA